MTTLTNESWREELQHLWGKRLKVDEPMSRHTSFRIGGPACALLVVTTTDELCQAIRWARHKQVAYYVIGHGSNILVADAGLDGLVIVNRCETCGLTRTADTAIVSAESGISLHKLVRWVAEQGWSGLEWASGIPGSLGGAIVGNAGAYGNDISQSLVQVEVLDGVGQQRTLTNDELDFGYRASRFKQEGSTTNRKLVILNAELALHEGDPRAIRDRVRQEAESRSQRQPLGKPSAGSIFKNPHQDYAGRLIETAGLKGIRIGDAQVSMQHANFIINLGNATAHDVMALIELIREKVWQQFSQELDLEIEYIGQHSQTTYSGKEG